MTSTQPSELPNPRLRALQGGTWVELLVQGFCICSVLGGWELLRMGKWSEFTWLADRLRTCPQGEVKRHLGANLPCSRDSVPATGRTLSLLWAWTGLSVVLWAKSHLAAHKISPWRAWTWRRLMLSVCHLNVSSTCGATGKSQRCPLGQGYSFHFVLGVERHFSVKSSWALSIRYDTE